MKKYILAIIVCFFVAISCKNETNKLEEDKPTNTQTTTSTPEANAQEDRFKFSLAQWSLHQPFQDGSLDPMNFAQIAKDLGFSGVEYVTQLYPQLAGKENDRETIMQLAQSLLDQSEQAGVDNVLIMVDHAGELADPDPLKRKQAIQNHVYWLDAAKLMGAKAVRANLFGELDPVKWHQYAVNSLNELGAYGQSIGVHIIIENHGGWSSDSKKLAAVLTEVDNPNVGTLPDFGNFCVKREGGERWSTPCVLEYDMYVGTKEMMPFAKGVSAKSYAFDDNGNETKIDYPRMMQIVADAGYKGYIGVEYEGNLDDPKEGILLTKKLLEKSIQQLR
ncbi:MAG: sugar phosphate isomerase/epimerase family protein [Dokdonia sp.]|jgi:sugar phosphate isomerase/epimerase|nr:xylose isomerase [Cytophagaceae bacterium]|tara:strand:+ start:862 stop:1860 length:999 start_codon:yes stop_codon:yes gene_type:complete